MNEIKEYNIKDLYIGFEEKAEYSEFLDEYEMWEECVILERTKYSLSINDVSINVYKYIDKDEKMYINDKGFVINSYDEITAEERYHKISKIVSVLDLLKDYEEQDKEDTQYFRYVEPKYERVKLVLNSSETITSDYINDIIGDICDVYSYTYGICDEEDYEDLLGCKVYDFETGCRILK